MTEPQPPAVPAEPDSTDSSAANGQQEPADSPARALVADIASYEVDPPAPERARRVE